MPGIDSYTKFCANFNGTDGSTDDYTAETGQTVTTVGDAQLDTAQKVFGSASLLLDGDGDYGTVADEAWMDIGTADFVIDFRIRLSTVSAKVWFDLGSALLNSVGVSFYYDTGKLYVVFNNHYVAFGSGAGYVTWTPSQDTWYFVALTRSSGTVRFYINENQTGGDVSDSENLTASTYGLTIGARQGGGYSVPGWIDAFRISVGTDRGWTGATITVPTEEYSSGTNVSVSALTLTASVKDVVVGHSVVVDDGALTLALYNPSIRLDSSITTTVLGIISALEDPTETYSCNISTTALALIATLAGGVGSIPNTVLAEALALTLEGKFKAKGTFTSEPNVSGGCPLCGTYNYE